MESPPFRERLLLGGLFFFQAHSIALWFVPFSSILESKGLGWMVPWAFASSALAAFISPMLTGALADKHLPPVLVLRFLALAIAGSLCMTFWAIENQWPTGAIFACIQLQHLCSAPAWGLTSQLVLTKLPDPGRQFGSIRAWATYGWMAACLFVSWVLSGDQSTRSGFFAAAMWIGVAAFTFLIQFPERPAGRPRHSWRDLFGFDAFRLLQNREHRGVFVSAGLLSIPLAAFYPYTPLHLHAFEIKQTSAWMALGQISEVASMYALASLLSRLGLRGLFLLGIGAGFLRYILFSADTLPAVLAGIFLHGICFTLFFIPAQIYVEQRIDPQLRYRAQALLTLLINGFGNLFGYLGCGWLFSTAKRTSETPWPFFWIFLAGCVFAVGIYFFKTYPHPPKATEPAPTLPEDHLKSRPL